MNNYNRRDYDDHSNDVLVDPLRNKRGSGILGERKENRNDYERSDNTECGCWANGEQNGKFCEGNGWNIDKCLTSDNEGRCHWGPEEVPRCHRESIDWSRQNYTVMERENAECSCWANGEQNEKFCEGNEWNIDECLTSDN